MLFFKKPINNRKQKLIKEYFAIEMKFKIQDHIIPILSLRNFLLSQIHFHKKCNQNQSILTTKVQWLRA